MSEQNKNRNKDTGKQRNVIKYDTTPKRERNNTEFAEESEFLNLDNKRNKRARQERER
ncbi:hypothetical protein ACFOGI_09870 [Virgibacillus xinjiangensis]|uniref:YfhD-like protein n=1 Tax=Virgibacillus xinjiangensis TaxID=393090 RepID=A0ABV7CVU3_9BACI